MLAFMQLARVGRWTATSGSKSAARAAARAAGCSSWTCWSASLLLLWGLEPRKYIGWPSATLHWPRQYGRKAQSHNLKPQQPTRPSHAHPHYNHTPTSNTAPYRHLLTTQSSHSWICDTPKPLLHHTFTSSSDAPTRGERHMAVRGRRGGSRKAQGAGRMRRNGRGAGGGVQDRQPEGRRAAGIRKQGPC